MLAVSPLRNTNDERERKMESFAVGTDDYLEFGGGNLLDSIDFDDLFVGFDDGNVLPDLEMDPEIFADFSVSGNDDSDINASVSTEKVADNQKKEDEDKVSACSGFSSSQGEESVSKSDESVATDSLPKEGYKGRKSSSQSKNSQGKRKVKVDWTPELHRRFVQAVEQLGVDKAVPSRILEIMGIGCLTRHNIASHLQKYRSHRKHLLAREAEAASWSQRRQIYGGTTAGGTNKRDMGPWVPPTMGFPPVTPVHPFRPLHVWGHPTVDQSAMHWPKHMVPPPPPPRPHQPPLPMWPTVPPPPLADPSYWHSQHRASNALTPGTPCYPQPLATPRFAAPPAVPGVPPHAMYKVDPGTGFPCGQSSPHPPLDFQPSKESIDAAIGDALSKPWLPLPLGLKPPSTDSVMVELQRQGIPKIPPTCG